MAYERKSGGLSSQLQDGVPSFGNHNDDLLRDQSQQSSPIEQLHKDSSITLESFNRISSIKVGA